MSVVIAGTNFTGATSVSFGSGITVNSYTVDNSTQITANITISGSATTGARDVSVTAPGGTATKSAGFTVSKPLAPPTNVIATDGTYSNMVQITWTNVIGATSYKVFRNTTNNTATAAQIGTATVSPYNDTTAVVGTTYYYWVKATNTSGDSSYSYSNIVWRVSVAAPTNVIATDGTYSDKVQISWTNVIGATSYKVFRNTTNNTATAAQIGTATVSPYNDTTAVVGTTYYYWVKATNTSGDSGFSYSNIGWRASVAAPTNVIATDGTYSDKVQITWTNVVGATSYKVFRNTTNSTATAAQIGTATVSPYNDTTAVVGTTYYYWVKATNASGDSGFSYSNIGWRASVAAPTNVIATDGTYSDKVQITWTNVVGATSYKVFRNTTNSSDTAAQIGTATVSPYNDTTAVVGTTYYYWVKATNASGDSGFSYSNIGWR